MAENQSSSDKSEKATPYKLKKAKEKGDIPRSRDITTAVSAICAFIIISTFCTYYLSLCRLSFLSIQHFSSVDASLENMFTFLSFNLSLLFKVLLTLLPIPIFSIVASMIPGGWIFTVEKLKFDLKKLNPISGIKRLFSLKQLVDTVKMIAKCIILVGLLYLVIHAYLPNILSSQSLFWQQAIPYSLSLYQTLLLYLLTVIFLFGAIDIPISNFLFMKKMRMTKQEVKEEHKNIEGRPEIKSRIRQLQRQMSMGLINKVMPVADVVITNPTHYAVVLKYDPKKASAPYVLAKGVDDIAFYIREIANKHHIEVIEFPAIARAIYNTTRINQQIPTVLYKVIAQVLTYVIELKAWKSGKTTKPTFNAQMKLPKEVMELS